MDIVKDSTSIHAGLLARWKELQMNQADVIRDAAERGMSFTKSNISAYIKHKKNLTQKQIVWLCLRYGIPIVLVVGEMKVIDGQIKNTMPKYDELKALQNLEKYKHVFDSKD